jgi:hypothetical protein
LACPVPGSPTGGQFVSGKAWRRSTDLRGIPGWGGELEQLRLDFSDGTPLTGTCRIDYVWVGRQRK